MDKFSQTNNVCHCSIAYLEFLFIKIKLLHSIQWATVMFLHVKHCKIHYYVEWFIIKHMILKSVDIFNANI